MHFRSFCRITTFVLISLIVSVTLSQAENWPTWRGPQQNGISQEKGLPVHWSPTENIAWKLPLPGVAPSTPIVWEDQIFLTTTLRNSEQTVLLCVNTTGQLVWQRTIGEGESEQAEKNNLAAPSPCTDGQHVWTVTGNGTITCHDLAGNQKWQFRVDQRYETIKMPWGLASSPVTHDSLLYLQLFHLNSRRILALDKTTGAEVWNVDRETGATGKCLRSYATPTIFRHDDLTYLLSHGQDFIVAHDLADGSEFWRCGDFHPRSGYDEMMHVSSSPVVAEGLILVPSGKDGNFQVLRGDGQGEITGNPKYRLWQAHISPMRPSALLVNSLVYICDEAGVLLCLDAKTGKKYYRRALHRHTHFASPVYADGNIYFTARDGTTTVITSGPEFTVLSTNPLDETICASPVISKGRIYLRSFEALYAIERF